MKGIPAPKAKHRVLITVSKRLPDTDPSSIADTNIGREQGAVIRAYDNPRINVPKKPRTCNSLFG
jgi:hypothetical protein